MNTSNEFDTDVVVVGSGPMGGTTALALATYGVRVHVVSKWNWVANTPRAHIINQRAVEVLRDLGVEEDTKLEATPWDQMGDTLFTTSLGGPEVARLQTWGTGDDRLGDYLQGSPCTMLDVPQPLMEPVLITNAAKRGAKVSFNTEYLSHTQDADGVTVTLHNRISDTDFTQRARFLVGADGARSQIAEDIGLEISGELARAGTVYARFDADLSEYVAHRPSILHWIMNPAAGFGEIGMGLLRAVRPWDQWIAGWGFDLKNGEPDLDHGRALEKIRALVGDPNLDVDIVSVAPWYVNQAYAPTYSVGRVLCGGDAVHRHPPSSGLGSNTCVQDGFNLAWKLALRDQRPRRHRTCSTRTRWSGPRSGSRSCSGPTSPGWTTPRCGPRSPPPTPTTRSPPVWRRSTRPPPRAPRSATPSRKRCSSRATSSTRTVSS